ncbi:cell adhesion molecule Dscam1 isoform X2 [Parasteatoda tepidariorum]|uniref:cell adhesion molecule Dscam1 isoform X2 n=1 Tax=Parasteatoda tepidariorum TaxID=114398 RepID=UPI001C71F32F|nr:Down syndrome cell adhesion molecule-like protein Dscam2 isoform X2 [Parasteatoda tepidariorum]
MIFIHATRLFSQLTLNVLITLFIILISVTPKGECETNRKDIRGPFFRNEPPARVEFSNSSGTEIRCSADGLPTPKISWQARDGSLVKDISGLRHLRSDGTLVFPPFSRSDYRQDVHDAVYQCSASNTVGSVISREVHARGVMKQRFNPQVYDDFVVRGNTAVLRCHLPSFVREYVVVDSWIRNDDHILKITENKARSYTVLRSGELLIHDTQEKDSNWSYRCQTRHKLTGEMVTSVSSGKITVTEPHASTLPRVTFHQAQIRSEEGATAQLPCVAQGNPPPTYRWMKDVNGVLRPVKEDGRIWVSQGTLNIKKVTSSDGGKYQCIVRNSIGERRIESALVVTAPLMVHLSPSHQVLNIGQEATFNCNVTGYPIHTVTWKKDQRPLPASTRVRLLSREVLHILSVRREDRGMYQCFAFNDADSAQGAAELKISDVAPILVSVFPEHTVNSGDSISLKCISTGNPVPRVTWYLDDAAIGHGPRVTAGDNVSDEGHVISFLNVTEIRVEDSGEYKCHVSNDVGSAYHSNRLNVYGPPFVRRMANVTAISGEDLVMRCPYGGHPIKGIRWLKSDNPLPLNHRQKINHGGSLTIQSVERLADEGQYSCIVRNNEGETSTSSTHVSVVVSPVIESHFFPESVTVDEGSRTKLMCVVTKGDPPLRFQWLKNGLPFLAHGDTTAQTFDDSSIVTFKKVSSSDRGHYTCVVSNVASSTNLTMQLVVNVPPQWTVEPRNLSVVLGNTVWMDCAAVGFPAPNILWKKMIYTESTAGDFTYVHSSPRAHRFNNGTLVLSEVEESDSGSYLCQASNGIGAGLSKIITIKVLVPPRFKDPYQTKTVTEDSNATLSCSAIGDPPIIIKWFKNKAILESTELTRYAIKEATAKLQTLSELRILKASRDDSGIYTCNALSDIGADESVIKLIVQGVPDAPSNVSVTNVTSRSISLQWEVLDNGNSHITGSIVQYQTFSDKEWNGQTSQLIVSSAETSATIRGLTPVALYYIRVIAENSLGKSKPSDILEITTDEEAPAGAPMEVHVHSTGAQSMKVIWKPPPEELRYGELKGYYVGYRASSTDEVYTFKQVEHSSNGQQSTYITGLQPFTEYDIVIKAYNSAGAGPDSMQIMGKTLETAPTSSPAFGKRETDVPFYKNVTLVVPIVVSSLVLVIIIFIIVVCLRKHSDERDGRLEYENRKDTLMMKDLNKQINTKSTKPSHYSCPTANKGDYAEPYTCIESVSTRQQSSDGLFATIKRGPSRPIYMSNSYKQGASQNSSSSFSNRTEGVTQKLPNPESVGGNTDVEKWSNQTNISQHKPMR